MFRWQFRRWVGADFRSPTYPLPDVHTLTESLSFRVPRSQRVPRPRQFLFLYMDAVPRLGGFAISVLS